MTKQEMLHASAKVAEHLLNEGISERAFKKMGKLEMRDFFPEAMELKEIKEDNFEEWVKHNDEHKSLNYFKSLVAFDMSYLQRKK